jgi:methylglutaconyl-CoA hydratase
MSGRGSSSVLAREDRGPIVVLILNRPDRRNALSRELVDRLSEAIDELAVDASVRILILSGAGSCFCAGMDLKEAADPNGSVEAESLAVRDAKGIAHLIQQIHTFPKITVAELNGDALGGGAGLAMACDFLLMADRARIGFPEVLRGLVPAIVVHDVVRHLGDKRTRQLLLTGSLLSASQAFQWGLANQVIEADSLRTETLATARRMLAAAPRAIETTKRLIDEATRWPADLRGAAAISAAARVSDEATEGLQAFLEKRRTRWDASTDT